MLALPDTLAIAAALTLELELPPEDAARLTRLRLLAPLKTGRARSTKLDLIWHDTPDAALAAAGEALCEHRDRWRLELAWPQGGEGADRFWPPGAPAPLLAEAETREALALPLADALTPRAAFAGRRVAQTLLVDGAEVQLSLIQGSLRAVADQRACARLRLSGPEAAVTALALLLAGELALTVPRASLAAEALAVARAAAPTARALGPPALPPGLSVAAAFARVVGHLADVILHWAPAAAEGAEVEPVHQMRVAVRRLRSALSVFAPAADGPAAAAAREGLRQLGARLGPARDWDVFMTGTGRAVGAAFPDERAVARLLEAGERRRRACYAELRAWLAGPEHRRLAVRLAVLAGGEVWIAAAAEEQRALLAAPLAAFAGHTLTRRLKKTVQDTGKIVTLPTPALHDLRLHGKRLRYAAEFFATLYPGGDTRRFLRRLAALQEALGHLNDGAVAAGLLAELGGGGAERALAGGIVRGYVAAGAADARTAIAQAWKKFRRTEAFWK